MQPVPFERAAVLGQLLHFLGCLLHVRSRRPPLRLVAADVAAFTLFYRRVASLYLAALLELEKPVPLAA